MAKGIQFPVRVGARGGVITAESTEIRKQNILLAVRPASSLHPWHQKLTPPEEVIFDIADEMTGGLLLTRIYQFFEEQERLGLSRLASGPDAIQLDLSNRDKGEIGLIINYIDLEDNESRSVRFTPGRRR